MILVTVNSTVTGAHAYQYRILRNLSGACNLSNAFGLESNEYLDGLYDYFSDQYDPASYAITITIESDE